MPLPLRSLLLVALLASAGRSVAPPPILLDPLGDPLPPGALARHGTVRLRHGGVQQVAFTADGRRLLSYGGVMHQELRLWDTGTGRLLLRRRLPALDGAEQVVFAPDGGVFLMGMGGIHHLKDLKGPKVRVFEQMDFSPMHGQVSPDGRLLAVATLEGGLVIDLSEGKVALRLEGGAPPAMDAVGMAQVGFSRDGKLLAQTTPTGELILWDTVLRKKLHSYPAPAGMPGPVPDLALTFSPDGRHLLTATPGKVRLLETAAPREVAGFQAPADPLFLVRFSGDGKQLVALDQAGNLRRYDATTGKDVSTTTLPFSGREGVGSAAFSPDRATVAVVENTKIHLIDLKTGKSRLPQLGDREPVRSLRWSRDGDIVSLAGGNRVRVWAPRTGRTLRVESVADGETIIDVDRDGKLALTQAAEQPPRLLRLADKKELWKADDLGTSAAGVQFSPDGRWVVTQSGGAVDVRDLQTGKARRNWKTDGDPNAIPALAWSADGRSLALLDVVDARARVFEFATGRARQVIACELPVGAAFCPRGRHLAVASADGVVKVYRLGHAQPVFEVVVRWGGVGPVAVDDFALAGTVPVLMANTPARIAFSPDGRLLAAVCAEDVRVWDMTGKPVGVFRGHDDGVLDLAFAPDGRTLVTASGDGTALVWDMNHLKRTRTLTADTLPEDELWAALASEDGEKAFRAVAWLREHPPVALRLFATKIAPAGAVDAKAVRRLLDELEADTAADRRKAAEALEALDMQAGPYLSKALEATRSAEVRRAVTRLLANLDGPATVPDRVREVRAVEVLEGMGDAKAKALLEVLAKGADSRLTREAKEALARLAARPDR
ncbi:MAG: hypothetical protein U0797_28305 [Gemmataceae bacterium]